MLIDEYLPSYDASEKHSATVEASAERIYTALRTADLAACKTVRLLLTVRALPGALLMGSKGWRILRARMTASIRLQAFEQRGFTVLDEDPPRELLIGLTGRFWTLRGGLTATDAKSFVESLPPGCARAAWNLRIEPVDPGRNVLVTETRVQCADRKTRRKFGAYWLLIRPGSGLIRRCMLRAIKEEAETWSH